MARFILPVLAVLFIE